MPTPSYDRVDHSVEIPDLSTAIWQSFSTDMDDYDLRDYEVCKLGFIRKKEKEEPIHHHKGDNGYVYAQMKPHRHHEHRTFAVHRIIAYHYKKDDYEDCMKENGEAIVHHRNSIKHNNSVNNLQWVTYSRNSAEASVWPQR